LTKTAPDSSVSHRLREQVLVVSRPVVFPEGAFDGFSAGLPDGMWKRIAAEWRFVKRSDAENDPSLKQIIPYLVLRGDSGYFLYKRLPAGGETRLRGRYSIGIGGHISREDARSGPGVLLLRWSDPAPSWLASEFGTIISRGLVRELTEEVDPGKTELPIRFLGLINDEVVPVARVHIGFAFLLELGDSIATVNQAESDQLSGEFASSHAVMSHWDRLEGWSQILSRALFIDGTE
jgi:predicted NUDIX family phosphoesterase